MLTHTTLRQLASMNQGPKISVFVPTSPSSDSTMAAALHLKNLLKEAREKLGALGVNGSAVDDLLAPVVALETDRHYWQHQQHGLALFLSPDGLVHVSAHNVLDSAVVVGDDFDILPLLPGLTSDDTYVVVCASQDEVAIYRGSALGLEALTIDNMPTSLDDVLGDVDYENPVLASPPARPNTGTHNMANTQVYGDAPPEWQAMVRRKFAGRIAGSLGASAVTGKAPIILIADYDMSGELAEAIGAAGVDTTHPASLSLSERHAVSWRLVHTTLDDTRQRALKLLAGRLGRNEAVATDLSDIDAAGQHSRIDTLFIATSTPNPEVSRAVWNTLGQGGSLVWAGDATPPLATGAAALLRF